MIRLPAVLDVWGRPEFDSVLKRELEQLEPEMLPLQRALTRSSNVANEPRQVVVLAATDEGDRVEARVSVFYAGVVSGCSCADDPTPPDTVAEHCQLRVSIGKSDASLFVELLDTE